MRKNKKILYKLMREDNNWCLNNLKQILKEH
jgi:hypothetical protein